MEFKLPLPNTPHAIENFIVGHCSHYGYTNCKVYSDGDNLIIKYDEKVHPPSVPEQSSEGLRTFRC